MTSLNFPRKPVVVGLCLAVAALHFVTGPQYSGPFRAFVTGYLIDLALPFALVLLLGVGLARVPVLGSAGGRVCLTFTIGAVVEWSQYLGVPLFGRTFDPVDLVAYATGAILALGFEKIAFSSHPDPQAPNKPLQPTSGELH